MMTLSIAIAAAALAVWIYLIAARGAFWCAAERDDRNEAFPPQSWPAVTAVIPARDEASVITSSLGSLLDHDYPGKLTVILVDDQSRDGTAEVAVRAAATAGATDRLTIIAGKPLPAGWTGKVWAMHQGVEQTKIDADPAPYVLLTDADIVYDRGALRRLVARAEAGKLALASLMVQLNCQSLAERMLVPAFVYFFQMLYPFAWVNRPNSATAAAAGGCMLVRREALYAAGGIAAIRGALIDDCALGAKLKQVGPIWLGLTEHVHSLRPYPRLQDARLMVTRFAYYQLRNSPLMLAGATAGLALTFLAPPLTAVFAPGIGHVLGLVAYGLIALSFQPILRLYRGSPLWGLAVPVIAAFYMVFMLDSAYQHWRGRGGTWKGRVQAQSGLGAGHTPLDAP